MPVPSQCNQCNVKMGENRVASEKFPSKKR